MIFLWTEFIVNRYFPGKSFRWKLHTWKKQKILQHLNSSYGRNGIFCQMENSGGCFSIKPYKAIYNWTKTQSILYSRQLSGDFRYFDNKCTLICLRLELEFLSLQPRSVFRNLIWLIQRSLSLALANIQTSTRKESTADFNVYLFSSHFLNSKLS